MGIPSGFLLRALSLSVLVWPLSCGGRTGPDDQLATPDGSESDGEVGADAAGSGNAPTPVITQQNDALDVAVHAGRLYWTSLYSEVRGCEIARCAATLTSYAGAADNFEYAIGPVSVVADDERVYWANSNNASSGSFGSAVVSCPIDGCKPGPQLIAAKLGLPTSIAVDETHIYWTAFTDAGVFRCPKTGCAGPAEVVILGQDAPAAVAVDADAIYWLTARPDGAVRRISKDLTVFTELAVGQNQAGSLTLSDDDVFWTTNWSQGSVMKCKKTGCDEPTVVASNLPFPSALVVDSSFAYWVGQQTKGLPQQS